MIVGPGRVAQLWFGDNERALAITIAALATPLGAVVAFVLPNFFVNPPKVITPADHQGLREDIYLYNIV